MSRSELERLVSDAEGDSSLRRALRHCRSSQELVLAARRLGYGVTRVDLQEARRQERQELRARRLSGDVGAGAGGSQPLPLEVPAQPGC